MENLKNLRKNKVDEKSVEGRFNLLSEKVRILQSSLDSICLEVHKKSVESIRLQNVLSETQNSIVVEKEEQKKFLSLTEGVLQEKLEQVVILKQKIKNLHKQQLVLLERLDNSKEEYSRKAISYNEIINSLSCKEVGLDLTIVSLQKEIDNKRIELQSVKNSCNINKERYISDEKLAIKKLKDIKDKKENIEKEILQLSIEKDKLESKWKELKEFEKYISREEKKVSKKEESVERLFNLLSKK